MALGQRPHTVLLIVTIHAVILIVAIVLIFFWDQSSKSVSPPAPARLPTVPHWTPPPGVPADGSPSETDAAAVREAARGLFDALGRGDVLGAARWIIPAADVTWVTNRLAGLTDDFAGTSAAAWRLEAPRRRARGGLVLDAFPLDTNFTGRVELELERASVGWRVAGLNLQLGGSASNAPQARLDFRPAAP